MKKFLFSIGKKSKKAFQSQLESKKKDKVLEDYWRFIENNIKFFESNPRLAIMTRSLAKMDRERKKTIFKKAESFVEQNTL